MSYYTTMEEDDVVDINIVDSDEFGVGDTIEYDDQEDGLINAMLGCEQRLADVLVARDVLMDVRGNNGAIVGVMAAMASMGIGGGIATFLHGTESADDADLSYYCAMEAFDKQLEVNAKGILYTLESWKRNKIKWAREAPAKAYVTIAKWGKIIELTDPNEFNRLTELVKVEKKLDDVKRNISRLNNTAEKMTDKLLGQVDAGEISNKEYAKLESAIARKREGILLRVRTEKADPLMARRRELLNAKSAGWTKSNLGTTIQHIQKELRPHRINEQMHSTVVTVKEHTEDLVKKVAAKSVNTSSPAQTGPASTIKPTSIVSRMMKWVGSHTKLWWAGIALAAAAVIGVCVVLWRAYKKRNKEDAERIEHEGELAEQKARQEVARVQIIKEGGQMPSLFYITV